MPVLSNKPVKKLAFAKAVLEEEETSLKLGSLEACRREARSQEANTAHHGSNTIKPPKPSPADDHHQGNARRARSVAGLPSPWMPG